MVELVKGDLLFIRGLSNKKYIIVMENQSIIYDYSKKSIINNTPIVKNAFTTLFDEEKNTFFITDTIGHIYI